MDASVVQRVMGTLRKARFSLCLRYCVLLAAVADFNIAVRGACEAVQATSSAVADFVSEKKTRLI